MSTYETQPGAAFTYDAADPTQAAKALQLLADQQVYWIGIQRQIWESLFAIFLELGNNKDSPFVPRSVLQSGLRAILQVKDNEIARGLLQAMNGELKALPPEPPERVRHLRIVGGRDTDAEKE